MLTKAFCGFHLAPLVVHMYPVYFLFGFFAMVSSVCIQGGVQLSFASSSGSLFERCGKERFLRVMMICHIERSAKKENAWNAVASLRCATLSNESCLSGSWVGVTGFLFPACLQAFYVRGLSNQN